ncbi:MAG: hypothetical protein JNK83_16120 [Rhizobiales bacterium]|nr:hypothetical protein [Hyphomicrobiales bacterium]
MAESSWKSELLAGYSIAILFLSALLLPANAQTEKENDIRQLFLDVARVSGGEANAARVFAALRSGIDFNGNGIELPEIEVAETVRAARVRAQRAGLRLRYDLDGDFAITREEVETTLRYEMGRLRGNQSGEVYEKHFKNRLDEGVLRIMFTDADGDGRLAGAEMSAPGKIKFEQFYLGEEKAALARALLKVDPNGDGLLTESETFEIWDKVFAGAKSP